jgi:hypothetical protein
VKQSKRYPTAYVPEASIYDKLATFGGIPRDYDDPSLDADELWEQMLNEQLKAALGWGTEVNMDDIIRRGRNGLDGLYEYVKYFVVKRGVSEALFEGKLAYLLRKIREKSAIHVMIHYVRKHVCSPISRATTPSTDNPDVQQKATAPTGELHATVPKSIDIEAFVFEDTLPGSRQTFKSVNMCRGYALLLAKGKSPYSSYPWALHDDLALPWSTRTDCETGTMSLFARGCTEILMDESPGSCSACQKLVKNKTLEGILNRIEKGVNVKARHTYHGISGLREVIRRKDQKIEFYKLRGLNQAKKLLRNAATLSDQKRLLTAIASGSVERVDRLISVGLRQKKGVKGLYKSYEDAAKGFYHPKGFSETEDMKYLLIWRLSGNRVAEINHRANAAPSVSYLRSRSTIPPIVPSPAQPTIAQVQKNAEATVKSVLDVLRTRQESVGNRAHHAVLMFDEIATEKRIRWDPKTNLFLGVCRQHAEKTSMEFVNEDDVVELYRCLDENVVHYAAEVRRIPIASVLSNPNDDFYIILLGTDRLEELFGILRTMVGNDANLDILQLVSRLAGTTEVANILAKYPQWDRTPRRLKLPALSRDSKELPGSVDHIKPASWRGNVRVADVSLQTSWARGRQLVEEECPLLSSVLADVESDPSVDMLAPLGTLLVTVPLSQDDVDESLDHGLTETTATPPNSSAASTRIDVEDAFIQQAVSDEIASEKNLMQQIINDKIKINGKDIPKAKALSMYSKFRKSVSSTDRLKRVQAVERYAASLPSEKKPELGDVENRRAVMVSDPIATLLYSESQFWLCIGELNGLRIDGEAVDDVSVDLLEEEMVTVSYQMLGLKPATLDDDPAGVHDWRTQTIAENSFDIPGYLIEPIDPTITSKEGVVRPYFLLQSSFLVALTASLFQKLTISQLKRVPTLLPTKDFPYREISGA